MKLITKYTFLILIAFLTYFIFTFMKLVLTVLGFLFLAV